MEPISQKFTDIFIDNKWINEGKSRFLFTGYRMINFGDWEDNFLIEFSDVRVGLIVGEVSYPHLDVEWDVGLGAPGGKIELVEENKTRNGGWLIFCQPCDESDSARVGQIRSSYCAMFIAILGRQIAYEKQFSYAYDIKTRKNIFDVGPPISPSLFEKLKLSNEKIKLVKQLALAIQEAEPSVKSRLLLSLHWFEKGIRTIGTDAFLSIWIALEAAAMPDTTDVKEIKAILNKVYARPDESDPFSIGKLFGIRSRIVHNGEINAISFHVTAYLEAIYIDIILHLVGMSPLFKTRGLLESKSFDIDKEIDKFIRRIK